MLNVTDFPKFKVEIIFTLEAPMAPVTVTASQ